MTSASNFLKIEATHYIVIVHITGCMMCLYDEQGVSKRNVCWISFPQHKILDLPLDIQNIYLIAEHKFIKGCDKGNNSCLKLRHSNLYISIVWTQLSSHWLRYDFAILYVIPKGLICYSPYNSIQEKNQTIPMFG